MLSAAMRQRCTRRIVSSFQSVFSRRWLLWPTLFLAATCFGPPADGSWQDSVVRVEEDWRIEIGVPNAAEDAPQIYTVISPLGTLDGPHALFELNNCTLPSFTAGGMQLQSWWGDNVLEYHAYPNPNTLSTSSEVIQFTTAMSLSGGELEFEIRNGSSSTWGSFGGQGYLRCRQSSSLSSLSSYSPDVSAENSRVGFASHRVQSLVLKQVRYYSASGLLATDSTERVVFQHTSG